MNTVIFEFPSNLGLKESAPGHEPGVKKLPAFLRKHHFHQLINPVAVYSLQPPSYSMHLDETTGVRNADKIVTYAREQTALIKQTINNKEFALVLGGDCSVLIGNALALKQAGVFGLFFLDGHTDFMLPFQSQTGGAAGMDLAIVTGYGHDTLTDIELQKPYFKEDYVWCLGNREYTAWYVNAIKKSHINYIDLKTLRQYQIKNCVSDFLKMIQAKKLDGFWIHIDVDVLNDDIMPAVDSRQADGLNYPEFNEILRLLLTDSKAIGLEITILDPELDVTGEYTRNFVDNFCKVFNSIGNNH